MKKTRKYSLNISLFLASLFLFVCAVAAFMLPGYINTILNPEAGVSPVPGGEALGGFAIVLMLPFVYAFVYMLLGVVALIDVLFINILLLVRKGLIFTKKSIDLLRGISLCFLGLAVITFPIAFTAMIDAFSQGFDAFGLVTGAVFAVSLFLGLCIRVIKNVLEEAIAIKSENDLTI
ncbi:MAG: DUF2975 domain-containing protein [Clostridia bacterium]|nr:DUF2975 domain-containing protein [Clostridia bacterium]